MQKKRLISVFMVFLLVLSISSIAQSEPSEEVKEACSGFFGWLGCLLFGSSEARAGKGWFDREDLLPLATGMATQGWRCTTQGGILFYGSTCTCESRTGCYDKEEDYHEANVVVKVDEYFDPETPPNFPKPPPTEDQAIIERQKIRLAELQQQARSEEGISEQDRQAMSKIAEALARNEKKTEKQVQVDVTSALIRAQDKLTRLEEQLTTAKAAANAGKSGAAALVKDLEDKLNAQKGVVGIWETASIGMVPPSSGTPERFVDNFGDVWHKQPNGKYLYTFPKDSDHPGKTVTGILFWDKMVVSSSDVPNVPVGWYHAEGIAEHVVQEENKPARPAEGYTWVTNDEDDYRVRPVVVGDRLNYAGEKYVWGGTRWLHVNSEEGKQVIKTYPSATPGTPLAPASKPSRVRPAGVPAPEPAGRGVLTLPQILAELVRLDELSKTNEPLALFGLTQLCWSGSPEACTRAKELSQKRSQKSGDAYDQAAAVFAQLEEIMFTPLETEYKQNQPAPAPSPPGAASAPAPPELTSEQKMLLFLEEMHKRLGKAQQLLGPELYNHYLQTIILNDVGERTESNGDKVTTYPLAQGQGALTAVESRNGFVTIYGEIMPPSPGPLNRWQVLKKDGVAIASQTNEQWLKNTLIVNGQPLKVAKGTDTTALKSGKAVPFFSEKGEKMGEAQATEGQVIVTTFREETQKTLNTKTGETLDLIGDYDAKTGFLPSGGKWTTNVKDAEGRTIVYGLDYDYEGTGAERKLSRVDVYDFQGNRVGAQFDLNNDNIPDRSYIQQGDAVYEVDIKSGIPITVYTKNKKGEWQGADGRIPLKAFQKHIETAYTSPGMKGFQTFLESVYALPASIKSYPAISKLLFGETTAYKDWQNTWDKAIAPMLSSNWAPSLVCEPNYRWKDDIAGGHAVIKTASGTYQAVASIQMERSEKKSPLLCQRNPDEEADEQWSCDLGQVCVDEQFCYADEDDEKPLQGYFYKITWAVSAPQDDALTLYVDENGVAVSFNIVLNPGNVPLYNRMGNLVSPLMLQNGASDKDAIIKYSPKEYTEACIVWHQAPSTTNAFSGTTPIPNVCFTATTSSAGRVEWQQAGQSSAQVSENKGEISRNTNW